MLKRKTKYERYQDYVIKNGNFIGEFEQMYKDFRNPWEQTTREQWAMEKYVAINLIKKLNAKKVIELGCGLGYFTNKIRQIGVDVLGVDISKTAIEKARKKYPQCKFYIGDIMDKKIYLEFKPDVIVMSEVTWYILDKIDDFIVFLKEKMKETYLIHLLTVYPKGIQKYGKDKFTDLKEIMRYFNMEYLFWGDIHSYEHGHRTFFLGKYK